ICQLFNRLPDTVRQEDLDLAEKTLVEEGKHYDPAYLDKLARRIELHLDPDGRHTDPGPDKDELHTTRLPNGRLRVKGELDAIGGATLLAALSPLSRPQEQPDGDHP